MAEHLDDELPGCSAAAGVDGDVVWSGAGGRAEMAGAVPMETTTRFNIGSVSMQFTALSVLMLAEAGELELDAPVSDYIDGLPAWSESTTLRDLMNHAAGILDPKFGTGAQPVLPTRADMFDALATDPSTHVDSDGFLYSNAAYMLLAMVVEEVTGEAFDIWLVRNVFEPADLKMRLQSGPPGDGDAVGYWEEGEPYRPGDDGSTLLGPTGVMSAMADLARWGDEYADHTLVSGSTFDDALARGTTLDGGWSYAAGILSDDDGILSHDGADDGMVTMFITDPETGTTLAVACNGPQDDEFWSDIRTIWFPSTAVSPSEAPSG